MGRRLKIAVAVLLSLLLLGWGALWALSQPRPLATPGPEAEALVDAMLDGVGAEAWARTGAVAWTFAGRNQHLWDRQRSLARVRWDDADVLVDLTAVDGRAWRGGDEVFGDERRGLVERAHAAWVNDAFWLAAPFKARDDGTERGFVERDQVLVSYTSGGLTPGDAYLWHLSPDGKPHAWQLWVSIIPVGGLKVGWSGWMQLSTGAWIATEHSVGSFSTEMLTDVRGAATVEALTGGEDPFAPLSPGGH